MRLETFKHRSQFDRLRRGRKWVAKGFILQGEPRQVESEGSGPRFGFIVSSKALKGDDHRRPGAVMRNRARRRLKEAVRLTCTQHARADYDYVVIGRRDSLHQRFADLLEELQIAFGKVNRPLHAQQNATRQAKKCKAPTGKAQRQTEQM